eukprot:TRINITY_DN5581_c0_g1_i1.p1 TRINITY_DN5581_c0_g1~~TRINITY_DN5581_c0_g1_i1.p1  ORF type:complete len:443 (-),score=86.92 TRINITY_DN5581_c0_g1_i1:7-1335(-)
MKKDIQLAITFDLCDYDYDFWSKVKDINDLVVILPLENHDGKKKKGVFGSIAKKKKKKVPVHEKFRFLYSVMANIFEQTDYNKLNAKKRIHLYYNMSFLKHFFVEHDYAGEIQETEIISWLQAIEGGLRNVMYEALSMLLREDVATFEAVYEDIKTCKPLPPMEDLEGEGLLDQDGCIVADEFLLRFTEQYESNYERLSKFKFLKIRHRFKKLADNIELAFAREITNIFTRPMTMKLARLHSITLTMREVLIELSDQLDYHVGFCHQMLEHIHLESYSPNTTSVCKYLIKHQEDLERLYGGEMPPLPFESMMVSDLRETLMMVENEEVYLHFKKTYELSLEMFHRTEALLPQKWPQPLPNLSTYNGKPFLLISCEKDYVCILGAYYQYINTMEELTSDWKMTIRTFYQIAETLSCFKVDEEEEEYNTEVVKPPRPNSDPPTI